MHRGFLLSCENLLPLRLHPCILHDGTSGKTVILDESTVLTRALDSAYSNIVTTEARLVNNAERYPKRNAPLLALRYHIPTYLLVYNKEAWYDASKKCGKGRDYPDYREQVENRSHRKLSGYT
jgi:hypothetical protein